MSQKSRERVTEALPGGKPGEGVPRRMPGGQALTHGAWAGAARRRDMGSPSRRLTTHRRHCKVRVTTKGRDPGDQSPATETCDWGMEHHLSGGKET